MSKKLNWRKAGLSSKRSLSVKDEAEYRDNDAADRWLERKSNHPKPKKFSHPTPTAPQEKQA